MSPRPKVTESLTTFDGSASYYDVISGKWIPLGGPVVAYPPEKEYLSTRRIKTTYDSREERG